MDPSRLRPSATLSQRVQDVAERMSTLAKAEIYQVLQGIAPSGDDASLLRLEPLVNDIVVQLHDSFKQAVTKRLLPEACKLLGLRPLPSPSSAAASALAGSSQSTASSPWSTTASPVATTSTQPQSPAAALLSPGGIAARQHSHLENDILALGLAPGTGQPLRPDQGPPQGAASAAASSLLLGASPVSPHPQHHCQQQQRQSLSPPPSSVGSAPGAASLHPHESRFAFANAADAAAAAAARRAPLSQGPLTTRDIYTGGGGGACGAAAELCPVADPLLFLGLGESGPGLGFGAGTGGGGGDASANGLAVGADTFLLGSSLAGSVGGSSGGGSNSMPMSGIGGGGGFTAAVTSPSPHASSAVGRQLGGLSLGGGGSSGGGTPPPPSQRTASAVSSPSPNLSTPSPYKSLPLAAIRPGSSLDPGLATPPVSLSGTEPVRGGTTALSQLHHHSHHHQQQQQQQSNTPSQQLQQQQQNMQQQQQQFKNSHGRLTSPEDVTPMSQLVGGGGIVGPGAAAPAPAPMFGGAPGPSPGGLSGGTQQQQQLMRQQQQQLYLVGAGTLLGAVAGEAGSMPGAGGAGGLAMLSNGTANGGSAAAAAAVEYQLQQQQHTKLQYLQQQQQHHALAELQRQHYSIAVQQQQQQQQLLGPQYDDAGGGGNFAPVSAVVQTVIAAAPEGPRASSYDVRTPTTASAGAAASVGAYSVQNAVEMPYDMHLFYGADAVDVQHGLVDRFASPPVGGASGTGGGGCMGPVRVGYASGGGAASPEYGMYGMSPLGGGRSMLLDSRGATSAGSAAMGVLQSTGGLAANTAIPGVGGVGLGRAGGAPQMLLAAATGSGAIRPTRGAAGSAASAVDSRSSSFSTGPMGHQAAANRRGSGNGGGTALSVHPQFSPQQASPPASDASGPSSSASISTGGGGAATAAAAVVPPAQQPAGSGGAAAKAAVVAGGDGVSSMSMAAKLQQVASKPAPSPGGGGGRGRGTSGGSGGGGGSPGGGTKAPADMPGRFRCLPPAVQARIHTLTRDNHVVLLKDFDEKVLSKMTLLVDKFGVGECLAMLDRIEEVLKGKAGRLANGPGYLDVSVSTRLDELKQRASGQVTAPEDYARSTLHSRIYAELRDLINRHGFLQWHHFDQGIINMLKKMPNATALERLNELAYHSFKNVDNPKSCIVSIFTTKPKYVSSGGEAAAE